MVRNEAYDLSELAIVTCLQAIAYDRPVVLLPVVVASRFQRGCLIAHASREIPKPDDLAGKRIGVRAYTQTTGMWVRAHLAEDYGVPPESMHWVTRDGAHVEQYSDPGYVEHSVGDKALVDLLRDGDVDAIVLGNDLPGAMSSFRCSAMPSSATRVGGINTVSCRSITWSWPPGHCADATPTPFAPHTTCCAAAMPKSPGPPDNPPRRSSGSID